MAMNLQTDHEHDNELLYVGFNQDSGCFACGTDSGFRIYNCEPFRETFRRDFTGGGIGIIEMLFRCNILALVGGGKNPRYPTNKVMIWDDKQHRCIGEFSFRSDVKSVRLRRDRVVVVLDKKIYVYNFTDLKIIDQVETIHNPHGLCALSPHINNNVLACPGRQRGQVRVELYHSKKTTVIPAHESELMALSLNQEGTLVATASERGTLIRVFSTESGQLQHEFRRGAERAIILSISFNLNSTFLACSSDKGTIHVFKLSPTTGEESGQQQAVQSPIPGQDSSTSFNFLKGFLPKYFSSEWSFAQFRVPANRSICAFGPTKNSLVVVCSDGSFYNAEFDAEKGGECQKKSFSRFVKSEEE